MDNKVEENKVEENKADTKTDNKVEDNHLDSRSTVPSILKMPFEIMEQICHNIQGPLDDIRVHGEQGRISPDNGSLVRLARTCKALAVVVRPILYEYIINRRRRPSHDEDKPTPIISLLRSISNPKLGELVKYADLNSLLCEVSGLLRPNYTERARETGLQLKGSRWFLAPAQKRLEKGGTGRPKAGTELLIKWDNDLFQKIRHKLKLGVLDKAEQPRSGHMPREVLLSQDLILPLFLAALPNLRKCRVPLNNVNSTVAFRWFSPQQQSSGSLSYRLSRIETQYCSLFPDWANVSDCTEETSPYFHQLTELEVVSHVANDRVPQPDCIAYLVENAPKLSTLRLENFRRFPANLVDFSKANSLTSISFIDCTLDFDCISKLVSSCRGLQEVEISYQQRPDIAATDRMNRESLPRMLVDIAMTPSAATLNTIKIGNCLPRQILFEGIPLLPPWPLQRLTSLKSLSIAEPTLFHPGLGDYTRIRSRHEHPEFALFDVVKGLPNINTLTLFDIDERHSMDHVFTHLAENVSTIEPTSQLKHVKLFYQSMGFPAPKKPRLIELFASENIELSIVGGNLKRYDIYTQRVDRAPFTPTVSDPSI